MTSRSTVPEQVDALVAGAGPGGLSAALELVAAGMTVAVVDSRRIIGHPVRCAEITGLDFFEKLGLEPREGWIRCRARITWFGGLEAFVLDRERTELEISQILEERGAIVAPATSVVGLSEFDGNGRRVTLRGESEVREIRARCVIAADGVASSVARLTGIDTFLPPQRMASGLAYRLADVRLRAPDEMVVEPLPPPHPPVPGYFWVLPNGEGTACVGLAMPGLDGTRVRRLLERMIRDSEALSGGRRVQTVVGLLSDSRPLQKPLADGVLVIGGAARFVNPVNGAGIRMAVESGKHAARTLIELNGAAASATALSGYLKRSAGLYRELGQLWENRAALEARAREQRV